MKVFNLKSKTNIITWSIVLGVFANLVVTFMTNLDEFSNPGYPFDIFRKFCEVNECESFYFGIKDYFLLFFGEYTWSSMVANQVFWIIISVVILCLFIFAKSFFKKFKIKISRKI